MSSLLSYTEKVTIINTCLDIVGRLTSELDRSIYKEKEEEEEEIWMYMNM
jgi:hypothetical protein